MGNMQWMQRHYGAIPFSRRDGDIIAPDKMGMYQGKELLTKKAYEDPDGIKKRYRTSPLVTMNQKAAFVSIKATLVP